MSRDIITVHSLFGIKYILLNQDYPSPPN